MAKTTKNTTAPARAPKAAPVTVAKDHGKPDARLAAIKAAAQADAAATGALVAAIRTMAQAGACTVQEVRDAWPACNSPQVYASGFNVGDRAATAIGEAKACKLIDRAAAIRVPGGLSAFQTVQLACRHVSKRRKDHGSAPTGHVADKWLSEALKAAQAESQAKADAATARKLEAKAKRAAEKVASATQDGDEGESEGTTPAPAARDSYGGAATMALNLAATMASLKSPPKAAGDWKRAQKLAADLAEALAAFRD